MAYGILARVVTATQEDRTGSQPTRPVSEPPAGPGSGVATVVDRPGVSGRAQRLLGADVETPRDAMRLEELQSTRVFLVAGAALAIAVASSLPLLDADPVAVIVLLSGIGVVGICMGWAAMTLRRPGGYRLRHQLTLAVGACFAGYTGIYYFGILSAASLATGMGIFFFGLTHRMAAALTGYIGSCIGPLLLWLLVITGTVEDRGVVKLGSISRLDQVVLLLLIQFVFFTTYVIARGSRRSRLAASEELEVAVRHIAHREALLREARRALEQALHVGGPGRFTDQVLGSFRLGVLAGRGAMGEVYEAVHVDTKKLAAVKLLSRGVLGDAEQVRRFIREANIARSLTTPHIVEVYEVGDDRSPLPYIAMELLRGRDLGQILRRQRRLALDECARMLDEISRGLDAAHAAGVIHRDIKPQNLYLQETNGGDGQWKILDFGVSRLISNEGTLTKGQAIGTPSYMSPEQARGHIADHRADIFALGVVVYRCLTGRPAFVGKEVPEILHNVVYSVPPRPSDADGVPPDVDCVLAIALAKDANQRYDSIRELHTDFAAALAGELPPPIRARGERTVARWPWGARP